MIKYVSLINPASSALMFIDSRLSFDNYRGIESSREFPKLCVTAYNPLTGE